MAGNLTDEHLTAINAAIAALEGQQENVLRAKQAGIDIAAQEATMKDQLGRLRAIKQAYFPGQ